MSGKESDNPAAPTLVAERGKSGDARPAPECLGYDCALSQGGVRMAPERAAVVLPRLVRE